MAMGCGAGFKEVRHFTWNYFSVSACNVDLCLPSATYLPNDKKDESGTQHQGEHVAKGRKGERHGRTCQPGDEDVRTKGKKNTDTFLSLPSGSLWTSDLFPRWSLKLSVSLWFQLDWSNFIFFYQTTLYFQTPPARLAQDLIFYKILFCVVNYSCVCINITCYLMKPSYLNNTQSRNVWSLF